MSGRVQSIAMGLLLILAFAAGWAVNGWRADAAAARVQAKQSSQAQERAEQSKASTEKKAEAVIAHGTAQQDNTYDYSKKMAELEAGRAADAVRIAGLQHDVRAAATRNAQLAGDAAACRDLADRHQRLAALAAEGAGLVGDLGGLVQKRDAQIALLHGQIAVDRKLLEQIQ